MMHNDYYGNRFKFFIGVVKDVTDPLNSNRVRVRIKGIHPEDPQGDGVDLQGGGDGSTGSGTGSSGTGFDGKSASVTPISPVPIDEANLPTATELSRPISRYYRLSQVTTNVALADSGRNARIGIERGLLTKEIIKNLATITSNVLDPLQEKFGGDVVITCGWRPAGISRSNTSNHGPGYAIDLQAPRLGGPNKGANKLYDYVQTNLRGRFTLLYLEPNHIHVQFGGKGSLDKPIIDVLKGA